MWFGIESGMYKNHNDEDVDAACIFVRWPTDEAIIWSDELKIPENFEKGPNGEWSAFKDPHDIITKGKRPRENYLTDAILNWKKEKTEFSDW